MFGLALSNLANNGAVVLFTLITGNLPLAIANATASMSPWSVKPSLGASFAKAKRASLTVAFRCATLSCPQPCLIRSAAWFCAIKSLLTRASNAGRSGSSDQKSTRLNSSH